MLYSGKAILSSKALDVRQERYTGIETDLLSANFVGMHHMHIAMVD